MNPPRLACPGCGNPIDVLRGSPRPGPRGGSHVVAAYPCGCWLVPQVALAAAAAHRVTREPKQELAA